MAIITRKYVLLSIRRKRLFLISLDVKHGTNYFERSPETRSGNEQTTTKNGRNLPVITHHCE